MTTLFGVKIDEILPALLYYRNKFYNGTGIYAHYFYSEYDPDTTIKALLSWNRVDIIQKEFAIVNYKNSTLREKTMVCDAYAMLLANLNFLVGQ